MRDAFGNEGFCVGNELGFGQAVALNLVQELQTVLKYDFNRADIATDVKSHQLQGLVDVLQYFERVLALPAHQGSEKQVL